MKKHLTWLITCVFVTVQFVNIAVLDAATLGAPETHGAGIHEQTDPGTKKAPLDSSESHCLCQGLHHISLFGPAEVLARALRSGRLAFEDTTTRALGQRPPVPPPLA